MNTNKFELHIDITSPAKAIDVLVEHCDLSKQKLKQVMNSGAVWLTHQGKTNRLRRAAKVLQLGQTVHLYYDAKVLAMVPPTPLLLADCQGYSLWHKPRGMLSQGSKWGDHCTIMRWAEQHLTPQRNAFAIHRLDRAASGLILVGHSKKATAQLCQLFQERQLNKRYWVVVHGQFPEQQSIDLALYGKTALSHATLKHYDPQQQRSLVEINIETGRKHQIRRHVASLGHPVVGDRLYGKGDESEDLQLTAYSLSFECPLQHEAMQFVLTEDLWPTL